MLICRLPAIAIQCILCYHLIRRLCCWDLPWYELHLLSLIMFQTSLTSIKGQFLSFLHALILIMLSLRWTGTALNTRQFSWRSCELLLTHWLRVSVFDCLMCIILYLALCRILAAPFGGTQYLGCSSTSCRKSQTWNVNSVHFALVPNLQPLDAC